MQGTSTWGPLLGAKNEPIRQYCRTVFVADSGGILVVQSGSRMAIQSIETRSMLAGWGEA